MSRIPPAAIEGPDADAEAVQRIKDLREGEILTLYRTLLHSGPVAAGWCALGTAIRYESSLDDRIRELVTCYVAAATDSSYEWMHHEPLALHAGATEEELASLPGWRDCPTFFEREQAALALAEATVAGTVDDAVSARAEAEFDLRGVVELVATAAYYLAVSRFLQAAGLRVER